MMIRSLIQGVTQIQPKFLGHLSLVSHLRAVTACDVQAILPPTPQSQQVRTTFILKRKNPMPLSKMHNRNKRLKGRHFVYELVEDINVKKDDPIKVILTSPVEGLGNRGDVIETTPNGARKRLLLPGLAVYASPENMEKYSHLMSGETDQGQPSSPFARKTASELSSRVVNVSMNITKPWKLEPWHIRVAFRKAGMIVPEEALTMPSKPIEGPDLSLQNKEFLVIVKINDKEEAPVRCRINHHSVKITERIPQKAFHWLYPAEPIFPDEAEVLDELTRGNPRTLYEEIIDV